MLAQQELLTNRTRVSFSPDGRSLVTGSADGTLVWWDAATLRKREEVREHKRTISAVLFSPDGKTLATADAEVIVTWEAASRNPLTTNSAQGMPVYALAFTQGGKQLIAARRDRALQSYLYSRTRWGQQVD